MPSLIEIYRNGRWQAAADIQVFGDAKCRVDYLPEYMFGDDPAPLAFGLPVAFQPVTDPDDSIDRRPPSFLYDLVPQGPGRQYLVNRFGMHDHEGLVLPLLAKGAFNAIGRLRISTAVDFYRRAIAQHPIVELRFSTQDVTTRSQVFKDYLAAEGMLSTGTTGVQGVAPKFLLTIGADGLWHADGALPDVEAREHWLIKMPRGPRAEDRSVLRNEAAYLRVAERCGLRMQSAPRVEGDMLFVRRFDRHVTAAGVYRLHQESLASAAGLRGFAVPADHATLLAAVRRYATDPAQETIEYLKRDVLKLALRDTDNHARNTALSELPDGTVQLAPIFDFAPMFLDPEIIARSVHWRDAAGQRLLRWTDIVEALAIPDDEKAIVASELRSFAETIGALPDLAADCGVDSPVMEACRKSIEAVTEELVALSNAGNAN